MASPTIQYKYLERDPKSSYKQLSIRGRRIRARTLYGMFMSSEEPRTVKEIAEDYHLPIEAVEEAIAYCKSNPPEIEEDFRRTELRMKLSGTDKPNYRGKPKPLSAADRAALRNLEGK